MRIALAQEDLFFALQLTTAFEYNDIHEFRHSNAEGHEVVFNLHHNDRRGFHGDSVCRGRRLEYNEQDLTNALAVYIGQRFGLEPHEIGVEFNVDQNVFTAGVDVLYL